MIPKIIHWCWLSGEPLPPFIVSCMDTWKKHMPDYEIRLWDMNSLDVDAIPYVAEAVKKKKWAFAGDYIRAYALYHVGGIYLDSDIYVRQNFDFVLQHRAFSAMETYPESYEKALIEGLIDGDGNKRKNVRYVHGAQIQAAILGSEKGHPFFKDILDYYDSHRFVKEDGTIDTEMISPFIYSNIAVGYGFKFIMDEQLLDEDIMLYSSDKFAPLVSRTKPCSYAVHCTLGSWRKDEKQTTVLTKLKVFIKKCLDFRTKKEHPYISEIRAIGPFMENDTSCNKKQSSSR